MADEKETVESKNKVTIKDAGPCKKKLIIEIPEETIKQTVDEQYEDLRKEAALPGFRKGRAPRRLLEKRFGKETSEQIKLKLIAQSSDAALKDNEIEYLREPDIDLEKIDLPETGPMTYEFEVEVRPEFDLPKLEGIEVEKTKHEVADNQVEKEIEQLLKWSGMWTPRAEGAAQIDDKIVADVKIKTEGVEEEQKLDNTEIFVRANGSVGEVPVENLDKILTGTKPGDTKQASIEVPKTYFREQYRGKKVDIEITVRDIKYLKPAEMNKELFDKFSVENETELKQRIKESLQQRAEQTQRQEMTEQIYKYLLDNTKFDLPLEVVAEQSNTLLQRQYINLMRQGLQKEQIDEQLENLKAASEQQAQQQLKTFFIMNKVAEKLDIKTTEEEINNYIAQMAIQRGQRPERMREAMARDGSLAQFGMQVREDKCIAKMLETAKITEVKPKKETKKAAPKKAEDKPKAKAPAKKAKKTDEKPKKTKKKTAAKTKKKTKE